jgi:ribosomal protein S12 methylthiotransferase accessory factor
MELIIDFPGGSRVDAHFGSFTVQTDQPPAASAPSPFDVFLSSIGTCAGIYVLGFCQQRGIAAEGIRIVERAIRNPSGAMVEEIDLEIKLPAGFPEKYREAVIHAAQLCAVKKHLEHPPKFEITTTMS